MRYCFLLALSVIFSSFAEEYQFAGKHFFSSYMGCNQDSLTDIDNLLLAVDKAVSLSGATILERSHYVFPPHGITIAYLLSESHASIHTYPEHGAIFVDLFTCGDHCSAKLFDSALREYFQPTKVDTKLFLRSEEVVEVALDW